MLLRFLLYVLGGTIALATFIFLTILLVMPRLNWSAASKPGAMESRIANEVRERWITIHAPDQKNPLSLLHPITWRAVVKDYDEHCAVCHGIDGAGRNRFQADFYPPVARLTGATQAMSDAEIYFVISNGVALSGMPAFGEHHRAQEIWKLVLWVRRLANLTPDERKKIERETSEGDRSHEQVMRQGTPRHDFDETH